MAVSLGVAAAPSVGRDSFELFLPLPTAVGVAHLRAAVSVSVLAARAAPEPAGQVVPTTPSIGMWGENNGWYG